jgi:predicted nucleic acid-binding protein
MSEGGRIVDTNVLVRLLRKDEAQHDLARKLVADATAAGQPLVLMDVVVAETVFVLESIYRRSRLEIADMMAALLDNAGIASTRPDILLEALTFYRGSKLHYVDCYLVAVAKAAGRGIATFDRGLRQFGDGELGGGG